LTAAAFERRLTKASAAIRLALALPDIIAVQEMENLSTLQTLAARLNTDAQIAGQGNPGYSAILLEGNDIGGIDVGFLVRSRVTVHETTQWGKDLQYTNPLTGLPELMNDRPSLSIRLTVAGQPVGRLPADVIVVVNHLRSLNGIDDPVDGARVRAKRQAQAEFLASVLDELQTTMPATPIVSVGDYNAFEMNDGYVDVMGTVRGVPAQPSDVVNASPDLVEPDFVDAALSLPADQRYSYSFDGNAQTLDHVLLSQAAIPMFAGLVHPRINADFPEILRNGDGPERLSDHDPAVAYFSFRADDVKPAISSISPSRLILWPANGALLPVHINIEASDNSGPPACGVESVLSSEPVTGGRFGNTSPDWVIDGPLDVRLRAERSLLGLGRLYAIKATCTDLAGNEAAAYTFVFVPRFWFQ
jgi:predicted extracellular nuclease